MNGHDTFSPATMPLADRTTWESETSMATVAWTCPPRVMVMMASGMMMIMVGSILLEKIGFTTAISDNDYDKYYETSVVETKEYTKYEWFCVMMLTFVVGALIRYAARVMIDEAMSGYTPPGL